MKTIQKIFEYIDSHEQASGKELADFLGITDRAVRKQLKLMLERGELAKSGKPPQVYYSLNKKQPRIKVVANALSVGEKAKEIVDKNFLFISPQGKRLEGWKGFFDWCTRRAYDPAKKAEEYVTVHAKYQRFKKDGYISGKKKMEDTFSQNLCLENVFYGEFYSWEIFGKTKLGQLLLYAKQNQDRNMMKEVISEVKPIIMGIIEKYNIEAVGYIPPSVKREVQFMKVFQKLLNISLPAVKLVKIRTEVITPQKTLSKLEDRIENANTTIVVSENRSFSNVLLLDDAVGSGATLNQVACKLKRSGVAQKVFGFSITGSAKGFDVISEV
jgi:hypothetical protein